MEDVYVTFEQAKDLYEFGFPEFCEYCYHIPTKRRIRILLDNKDAYNWDMMFACPTQSQAIKWLREEKRIHITVGYNRFYKEYKPWIDKMDSEDYDRDQEPSFDSYEEALSYGINKAIEML